MSSHNEIWIGLIGLYPMLSNTLVAQNQGAYANVLLMANDLEDYKDKTINFLSGMGFEVFEMEDTERLDERLQKFEVDSSIMELAKKVQIERTPQISTLHVFNREDVQ